MEEEWEERKRERKSLRVVLVSEFAFVIISPSMCSLPILPTNFLSLKGCMELVPVAYYQRSLTDSHVSSLFLLRDILARKSAMTDYMGIERYDGPNSVYLCSSVSSQNSQGGMITAV